eukprot:m.201446 g.201446  ORF g.201446 m.201446 type:complete len:1981 (-) comp17705_c0_seq2:210-6152(-)
MADAPEQRSRPREFARLKNKDMTAAEAREVSREATRNASQASEAPTSRLLPDFLQLQPPDFEAEASRLKPDEVKKAGMQDLLLFPDDDWRTVSLTRERRTIEVAVPRAALQPDVPEQIRQCVSAFTNDWKAVLRQYEHLAQGSCRALSQNANLLQDHDYQDDRNNNDADSRSTDSIDVGRDRPVSMVAATAEDLAREGEAQIAGMLTYNSVTRTKHHNDRAANRVSLFSVTDNLPYVPSFALREGVDIPTEPVNRRIFVDVKDIRFNFEAFEPMFGSVALYDVANKKRISENFYFDFAVDTVRAVLTDRKFAARSNTQAIFSLSEINDDIFMVFRVDKILEGDIAKAAETYARTEDKKDDKAAKQKHMFNLCKRLGRFAMPFGWTAVCLTDVLSQSDVVELELYLQITDKLKEEEMYKVLGDQKRSALKKLRRVPGSLGVLFRELEATETVPNTITPTFFNVATEFPPRKSEEACCEVLSFPPFPVLAPHTSYRHFLYVYPQSVTMQNTNHRNITCRVEFLDGEAINTSDTQGLPVIYNRHYTGQMSEAVYTSTSYHNRSPDFYDEIKIALPEHLKETHHLLFRFFHVSCKDKGYDLGPAAKPIGFAWLQFYKGRMLRSGDVMLTVASEIPPGYLSMGESQLRQLDGGKQAFSVNVRLESTVMSSDNCMQAFLNASREHVTISEQHPGSLESIDSTVRNLPTASIESIFGFLHVCLNQLFHLVAHPPAASSKSGRLTKDDVARSSLETIALIVHVVQSRAALLTRTAPGSAGGKSVELREYAQYVFHNNGPGRTAPTDGREVFEELVRHLLHVLQTYEHNQDQRAKDVHGICMLDCWFFFSIILKSMAQYLDTDGRMKLPRTQRFSKSLLENIRAIVVLLASAVMENKVVQLSQAQELILSIARFLRDLMTFVDRGAVFLMIRDVLGTLHQDPRLGLVMIGNAAANLRLDFLRIICSHEHFVQLNMPSPNDRDFDALTAGFVHGHYLAGLLLGEMQDAMNSTNKDHRMHAWATLRSILVNHDEDPRYSDPVKRARVVALYFPIVTMILNYEPLLAPQNGGAVISAMSPRRDKTMRRKSMYGKPKGAELPLQEQKEILLVFFHVIKSVDSSLVQQWWKRRLARKDVEMVLELLVLGNELFRYEGAGRIRAMLREQERKLMQIGKGGIVAEQSKAAQARKQGANSVDGDPRRLAVKKNTGDGSPRLSRPEEKLSSGSFERSRGYDDETSLAIRAAGNLTGECSLVVLDVLELFMDDFKDVLSHQSSHNDVMDQMFKALMALLKSRQSNVVLQHVFWMLQAFLYEFPAALFQGTTEYCAELCEQSVKYCSSSERTVREISSAYLYLLMRQNYDDKETSEGFSRVKVQTTIALSQIVNSDYFISESYLRRSLGTIISYTMTLPDGNRFGEEVRHLILNLCTILRNTSQLKQQTDPEMLIDLQHQIADGYFNSPDLRLTWLITMAEKHVQNSNYAEAAQCYVHASALVGEYMALMEVEKGMPSGCAAFEKVSPNVLGESATSDDISSPDKEGICTHKNFTTDGLIRLMETAIAYFNQASMFESANEMFKLLAPISEASHDYANLASIHQRISDNYRSVVAANESGTRYFASYFRVGFFGTAFNGTEIQNKQFVYREKGIVKLHEICTRFKTMYAKRFPVEVLSDSKAVDVNSLEPGKGYIQVTYVEPYFDSHDGQRHTHFEKNMHIKHFVFDTPFTMSGKAHGSVQTQYKRKTFLTVTHCFPYVKTRQEVVESREEELEPIQVATEAIETKTRDLQFITQLVPVNLKLLQLQLQGSVSVAVNEGPTEIANVFLAESAASKFQPAQVKRLRQGFHKFLKACDDALSLNEENIENDQLEYHQSMKDSLQRMKDLLAPHLKKETRRGGSVRDATSTSSTTATRAASAIISSTSISSYVSASSVFEGGHDEGVARNAKQTSSLRAPPKSSHSASLSSTSSLTVTRPDGTQETLVSRDGTIMEAPESSDV